jgi:beta-1,4-mannosyl-glycoprotein beta-1,4-N-acetylglucosaminyltransferase
MTRPVRIYDTFLFDGELDLLEHRLRETYVLVDKFVLVEAAETFRGQPKPLRFAANRARFAWAGDKLLAIAMDRLGTASSTPWERQRTQRNAILLGLRDARPDDIVLILDADEIASRALLERLRRDGLDKPSRLSMTRHYEYVDQLAPRSACCPALDAAFAFEDDRHRAEDWRALAPRWHGASSVAVRYRDLCGVEDECLPPRSPFELRGSLSYAPRLADAGRHFLAVDLGARLEGKLGRVSHAELGDARAKNPDFLARARRAAVHHHGWWYAETPTGPLPEDLLRLVNRSPDMKRPQPAPPMLSRRLLRSWAWLRYWPALTDRLVFAVDRRFDLARVVLAPLLLAADLLRHVAARRRWRWPRNLSSAAAHRHYE